MQAELATACAYCGSEAQPFDLDGDGDLVCRKGTGCSRSERGRRAPVARTRIVGPKPRAVATPARSRDVCACGLTEAEQGVWMELRGGVLLSYCPGCLSGAPA